MADRIVVLADKSVDLKRLRKLQTAGLIWIFQLDLENLAKRVRTVLPLAVYDVGQHDHSLYASDEAAKRLTDIVAIMGGRKHIADALTVDAAFRNGHLYVVTNDPTDFIRNEKKEKLEELLPAVNIVRVEQLEQALGWM